MLPNTACGRCLRNLCPGYGWESSASGPKTAQAPEAESCINEGAPNTTERWSFAITLLSFPTVVLSAFLPTRPISEVQGRAFQKLIFLVNVLSVLV